MDSWSNLLLLASYLSWVSDVLFKTNERESNLFAKLDISRVTRLLRASNLTSLSWNFGKCSVSLLSGLSLQVSIWEVFSVKVGLSEEISVLDTTLFVIELSRMGVCRVLSLMEQYQAEKANWYRTNLYFVTGFVNGHTVYCLFPLWNCKMSPGLAGFFYLFFLPM